MNREELSTYIDNCVLLGDVVTRNSEIYNKVEITMLPVKSAILLGSVNVGGIYVKKDSQGNIHLTHYDGNYTELDLGDAIDIIDDYAFYNNSINKDEGINRLHFVSGEAVVAIGYRGFGDSKIREANFPNVSTIGNGCFMSTHLGIATFNKLEKIPLSAFRNTPLAYFRGDEVRAVEEQAFSYSSLLKKLILPKLEIVERNSFVNCYNLSAIQIPNTCTNYEYIVGTREKRSPHMAKYW